MAAVGDGDTVMQRATGQNAGHLLHNPFDVADRMRTVDECVKAGSE